MANTIRIKRRITGAAGAPATLAVGELAFNEMDNTLYIGKDNNGSPIVAPVGGSGEFLRLSNVAQQVNGTITFATHPLVSAAQLPTTDNSTKVATTAWVKSLNYTTTGVTDLSFGTHNTTSLVLLSSTGTDVTFPSATTSLAGLMSSTDKSKLNGIASGATANTGTVTSVGLSLPTNLFDVSNSPVTTSGTLTATLDSQNANTIFAGPSTGGAAAPTFRTMVAADVPSLTSSKISDFNTAVRANRLDQMAAPTADVAMNNRKITGLATPTSSGDAANKEYVDATAQGIHAHTAVRLATAAALPSCTYANGSSGVGATLTASANGALTVDGVSVAVNDRILVKNQTTQFQNGVYVVTNTGNSSAAFVLTRATDMNEGAEFPGSFEFVTEGTTNADNGYVCTTNSPVTVGTTAIVWTQFSGAGQISAGNGLTKTGNTIDAVGTANRITVAADAIDIASTYVGQTSITTLGTVTTGTWAATDVAVAHGGTGVSTLTSKGIVYGNGTSAVGVTAAGTWDNDNSIGQILSVNSSGTPVWTNNIDGGTF